LSGLGGGDAQDGGDLLGRHAPGRHVGQDPVFLRRILHRVVPDELLRFFGPVGRLGLAQGLLQGKIKGCAGFLERSLDFVLQPLDPLGFLPVDSLLKVEADKAFNTLLLTLPNFAHKSVPIGADENDNVEVKVEGEKPSFDFSPNGHVDLCESLGLIDFKRGAKLAGSGFLLYTNWGARLERALKIAADAGLEVPTLQRIASETRESGR